MSEPLCLSAKRMLPGTSASNVASIAAWHRSLVGVIAFHIG
jgi:hypothetical protein